MEFFDLYFNIVTIAAAAYFLYTWYKLHTTGHLFPNQLLIPRDSKPEQCLDEEGFIDYMKPKLLICGLICAVSGAVGVLNTYAGIAEKWFPQIPKMKYYLSQGGSTVCLAAIILYVAVWSRARKRYW